ncbi:hypothetical protein RvY_08171 [Ramazzottius varieornatus]|uniref:Uncharacterized protein n=1 Tax=Ramazzottius varieornatus TaxID=947166 RepID=A0A1D1V798_RAMVA|nr:hypothetical protein RvY_08171 [Ramazzottius varieornatus]
MSDKHSAKCRVPSHFSLVHHNSSQCLPIVLCKKHGGPSSQSTEFSCSGGFFSRHLKNSTVRLCKEEDLEGKAVNSAVVHSAKYGEMPFDGPARKEKASSGASPLTPKLMATIKAHGAWLNGNEVEE